MKWLVKADSLVDDSIITWVVYANSPEEAEDIGYQRARQSSVADAGTVDIEPLEEDKQLICDTLLKALQLTRNLYDLMELKYDTDREVVTGWFANGCKKDVNVACDSGTSMIRDICKWLV